MTTTRRSPAIGTSALVSLVVAVLGLAVSAYLTVEHFNSSVTLACPESATVNCAKVTTSRWSHVGPVPVAVLGLAFFIAMTVLCLPAAWRQPALEPVRVAAAVVGTISVLYLVFIELFRVDAICIWCTAVHLCTVTLLGAILWHATSGPAARQ